MPEWFAPVTDNRISGSTFNNPAGHAGVDLWAPTGAPILAAALGKVLSTSFEAGGYGNIVRLDNGDGWGSWYAHMLDFAVNGGQVVGPGDLLGHADSTGHVTGPHLHFEIRQGGTPVDPWPFIAGKSPGPGGGGAAFGQVTDFGNPLSVIGDAVGGIAGEVLGPIAELIASVPATFLKVLLGGHTIGELVIRLLEIVGGAVVLATGSVMLLRVIATTPAGRGARGARSAGRQVARPVRRVGRTVVRTVGTPDRAPRPSSDATE